MDIKRIEAMAATGVIDEGIAEILEITPVEYHKDVITQAIFVGIQYLLLMSDDIESTLLTLAEEAREFEEELFSVRPKLRLVQ